MLEITHLAIESAVNMEVAESISATQHAAEDSFLYGNLGLEYLNLQSQPESQVEKIGYWTQPGNKGNNPDQIGPGHPTATYALFPGQVAQFKAKGSLLGQANCYIYTAQKTPSRLPSRVVDVRTFQIENLAPWRAVEWQCQLMWKGGIRNMAIQANLLEKKFRYFIYADTWHDFPVQPVFPDFTKPVQIYTEYALDQTSQTHKSMVIDGQTYALNVTNKLYARVVPDKSTVAMQIDPLKDGDCTLLVSQTDIRMVL